MITLTSSLRAKRKNLKTLRSRPIAPRGKQFHTRALILSENIGFFDRHPTRNHGLETKTQRNQLLQVILNKLNLRTLRPRCNRVINLAVINNRIKINSLQIARGIGVKLRINDNALRHILLMRKNPDFQGDFYRIKEDFDVTFHGFDLYMKYD